MTSVNVSLPIEDTIGLCKNILGTYKYNVLQIGYNRLLGYCRDSEVSFVEVTLNRINLRTTEIALKTHERVCTSQLEACRCF
ncbi:MAG TPA: hypothetical protein V6C81_02400 [Planktothrix sp.]